MPKRRLPYLQFERTRHGRLVWYVRVNRGPRARIPGQYGSREFMAAYHAAIEGGSPARATKQSVNGSLHWLVNKWRESSDWASTAVATRRQRENILLHVLETASAVPFQSVTAKEIREGRERRMATPFAANNFLKTMRALFRWAKEDGLVRENPAAGVKPLSRKTPGFAPWTEEDVARYRARWPLGTRQRVALEVLFNTGLRRGDAVRLGRQHGSSRQMRRRLRRCTNKSGVFRQSSG